MSDQGKIVGFFARHFVAIVLAYSFEGEEGPEHFSAASGTLLELDGVWMVLTAGHVISAFEEIINHEGLKTLKCGIADTYGHNTIDDRPIPFDLKAAPRFHVDCDGLDFGLLFLHPVQVRLLLAHGMMPIDRQGMLNEPDDLDVFWLLGLPAELNTPFVSENGDGLTSLTMLPVRKPISAPQFPATPYPRFVGELHSQLPVNNIEGMSGGPIFGFRKSDPTRFWIVAIQSSWIERRFIFGCPLRQIALLLDGYRDRALEETPDIAG